jgi:uncharacterized protein (TIGR03118 family)
MQRFFGRFIALTAFLGLVLMFASSTALAQYEYLNLTSNQSGMARNTDPLLINAWGLAYGPGGPFWISDEGNGWSTTYNGLGVPQSTKIIVPSANGIATGSPTGTVYNGSQEFQVKQGNGEPWPSIFLFATLDGTISGWAPDSNPTRSIIAVNNSSTGASYTGLAITNHTSGNFLYAADNANEKIDVYDGNFNLVMSFTDPKVPKTYSPFGVQDINGQVYVTFASLAGAANGLVDVYSESGTLITRLVHGKTLNQPWGVAIAPSNFGPLSNALLISNNTDTGTITGYNLKTGAYMGTVSTSTGKPIVIPQLWGIEFGGGTAANGKTNQLFFTAGPNNGIDGIFGGIQAK